MPVNAEMGIMAAFRMTEEDLDSILEVARVQDVGVPRPINIETDALNLPNLSTIYRHVVLAKSLKLKIVDVCKLIDIFDATPFSLWDIQTESFINIDSNATWDFYELARSVKKSGFKANVLKYILKGVIPVESNIGLNHAKLHQTVNAVHDLFCLKTSQRSGAVY